MGPRRFQKKHSMDFTNFPQLVEEVLDHSKQEEQFIFVGIAKSLWHGRNDMVFNGIMKHPTLVIQHTMAAMEEFLKAHDPGANATKLPHTQI